MARANRIFLPGSLWHVTHRCHKRAFLLKFAKDKQAWSHWLFESKKRDGLKVLNDTVTSNHIHLLVYDSKGEQRLSKSLQLIAGQTAQGYNQRQEDCDRRPGSLGQQHLSVGCTRTRKSLKTPFCPQKGCSKGYYRRYLQN